MREITAKEIVKEVARLCQEANFSLSLDVVAALKKAKEAEESPLGKEILSQMLANARLAEKESIPICQDTGLAVIFVELGQEVQVKGDLVKAINEGVGRGYKEGYLRKSVIRDPFFERQNTTDNTPALIDIEIVPGDKIKITMLAKGGGSEAVGQARVLKLSQGTEGFKKFVIDVVEQAGPNPCPPTVIGVGLGGSLSLAALMAKKALLRPIGQANRDDRIAKLEKELLEEINKLGIGPGGLGGRVTSLAVHIETYPSHIANVPVAVDISCYALRRKEATL